MALTEELVLETQAAFRSLDVLQTRLDNLTDVRLEVTADTSGLDADLSRTSTLAGQTADAFGEIGDRVSMSTDQYRQAVAAIESGVAPAEAVARATGKIDTEASSAEDSYRRVASALGISEDKARELAGGVSSANLQADLLEGNLARVAAEMGLSDAEARQFARTVRSSAVATGEASVAAQGLATTWGRIRGLIVAAIAAFGIRGVINQFSQATTAAAEFKDSINAVKVVFGDASDIVLDFADSASQTVGLAASTAQQLVTPIGALLQNFGFDARAAAEAAVELGQRAGDMASVFGGPVEEALGAISAALRGETDPIERFGASISDARVQAFALATGLAESKSEITDAIKVQARYGLVLQDTAKVQGDFANTAEETANKTRTVAAEAENARVALGEALLPAFDALLDVAPKAIDALENLEPGIRAAAEGFATAAEGADGFLDRVGRIAAATPNVLGAMGDIAGVGIDVTRALGDVFRVDPGSFNKNVTAAFKGIGSAIDRVNFNKVQDALIQTLNAGVEPARALEAALNELTTKGFSTDQVRAFTTSLSKVADVNTGDLLGILENIETFGESAGLTTDEVKALTEGITDLFGLPADFSLEEKLDLKNFGSRIREAKEETISQSQALDVLRAAAEDAGTPLGDMLDDISALPPELQEFAAALSPATIEMVKQTEAAEGFIKTFDALPGALDAAAEAMTDKEGEIVDDFGTFLANLREKLAAERTFQSNLDILRAFGLDALADSFEDAGIESATLLADAIANPKEAARAEKALERQYATVTGSLVDTISAVIEGKDLSPALIATLTDALESVPPAVRDKILAFAEANTVTIPVELSDEVIIPPNLLEGIDVGTVVIPSTVGTPSGGTTGSTGGGGASVPPNIIQGLGGPAVVQNFFATPSPTTDTARAAQTAAAVLAAKAK